MTAAAQSRDGHTLLMGSNGMVINPSFNPAIGYDVARDFDAVGMVSARDALGPELKEFEERMEDLEHLSEVIG